jgi:N6-adenosine-specific RNA methylase IME4
VTFHDVANLFPLMVGEPFADLVCDIKENSQREDIWLFEGKILDGRNRYRACLEAGVEPRIREWVDDGRGPVAFVVSENLHRRHLNESQRAMVAAKLASLPQGARTDLAQICARSQPEAAEILNVSRRSVQDAKVVIARGAPELNAAVNGGALAVSTAAKLTALPAEKQAAVIENLATTPRAALNEVRELRRRERLGAIAEATAPALGSIGGLFPVIYADPPWRYDRRVSDSQTIELNHYYTMPLADICALPVPAHRDAALFLWATSAMLTEAKQVIAAWGFKYVTNIVWDKMSDDLDIEFAAISYLMSPYDYVIDNEAGGQGLGFWTRNQHELLLIARRGAIPCPSPSVRPPSIIRARAGEHSAKPKIFYKIIERMYPSLPKLELFARPPAQPGWTVWGNQIPVLATGENAA